MGKRFVILGNGIAGFAAAEEIRKQQKDGEITIISDEKQSSYVRPLLSKTYLKTFQKDKICIVPEAWYEKNHIRQILGAGIEKIIPEEKQVLLSTGQIVPYDICIYALGSRPVVPSFSGTDKAGVMTVRNVNDFDRFRKSLAVASHAVVIGGGAIGLEMAWEIAQTGCRLTVLEAAPRLMGQVLDETSAGVLLEQVEKNGISVFTGVQIEEITGGRSASGVKLADGRWFPAELVILSCGVQANKELAQKANIACDRGVLVNDFLETNVPDIYAAGDCIRWKYPNPGLWTYSKKSGELAGYNASCGIKGKGKFQFAGEPVILNVMGTSLFSVGNVEEGSGVETVLHTGDCGRNLFKVNHHAREKDGYAKYFYKNNRLQGAVLIGDLSQMRKIRQEAKRLLLRESGQQNT